MVFFDRWDYFFLKWLNFRKTTDLWFPSTICYLYWRIYPYVTNNELKKTLKICQLPKSWKNVTLTNVSICYSLQKLIADRFSPYSRCNWKYVPVVKTLCQHKKSRGKEKIDHAYIGNTNNMIQNEQNFKTKWNPWTQFLCINDEISEDCYEEAEIIADFVREKLEKHFPTKSTFEK